MTKERWLIFIAVCVAVFGILIFTKKSDEVSIETTDPAKVITDNKPLPDNVFGTKSGKVVLIEYGDFQCPGCGSLYPKLHPIKEYYKEQLTFVFRDFPLTTIHPNALAAATAAEAAGLQSKFWEMHDKLYENQTTWSGLDADQRGKTFTTYAKEIGLDVKKFEKDLENKKLSQKISRDQALGKKIGATATPTLVLNGKTLKASEWDTPKKLEDTLRAAIKDSGQTLPPPSYEKQT